MISAPLRASEVKDTKPGIKTHGHLALLEWDEKAPAPVQAFPKTYRGTRCKSVMDRCYDGGVLVLMAVTAAAMVASLARF